MLSLLREISLLQAAESMTDITKPFYLVFDNCFVHSGIEEVVADYSNCVAKTLPPFPPELNVIEFMFRPFKATGSC